MAITDVRILRSLKITEQKSEKQTIQLSATQQLLFISDTRDPSFNEVLEDATVWPNLGNDTVPQIDDETVVKGVSLYVTKRDVAYYQDNERMVVMTIQYDAKKEPDDPSSPPSGTDAQTWQRITVASEQITRPATGWQTFAEIPAENAADDNGITARNTAGDPVDGLEEQDSHVKLTYTNTQVLNPNFEELNKYCNRCNSSSFLGAAQYKIRVAGWNAEYDQKNNVWSVSLEFLFNPDGWAIEYYNVGFNQIIDGNRYAIVDQAGNPVSKPVALDSEGKAVPIEVQESDTNTFSSPVAATTLTLYPYRVANLSNIFTNCRI